MICCVGIRICKKYRSDVFDPTGKLFVMKMIKRCLLTHFVAGVKKHSRLLKIPDTFSI